MYLDAGYADYTLAPALACRQCGDRIELAVTGEPLVIPQQPPRQHPMEQQMRVMAAQGRSAHRIAKELGCSWKMVREVIQGGQPV